MRMSNKHRLIIPAAKIVPEELQRIGKLPAIIYPVNQKIVFDYLLEEYQNDCSAMDVICYEQAAKVHRRLAGYHLEKLTIRDLAALGDLGHTIYYALDNVSDPIIINFADTIVADKIQNVEGDCFFYAEEEVSEKWTYFEEKNGIITQIYDKSCECTVGEKPLFVGVFKIEDTASFYSCLETAFEQSELKMSSFYYALMLYSQKHPMKALITEKWFDIGHVDKYNQTQLEVKAREFNYITIDKDRGILRKTSDDKEKFLGEILWYLKLPKDVEYVRPRIFSYSTDYNAPYVSMEYYAYHTVHELFLYGDLTSSQWKDIFKRIHFMCHDFKRYTVKDSSIKASLEDMYLQKTISRLAKLRTNKHFKEFFNRKMTINGATYVSLDCICRKLQEAIPQMLFDVDTFSIIHGDLCFANIMVDSNCSFVKVIDPRGKFGTFDIYGDTRYELAKLFHSVDGKYDFIIKDLFDISFDSESAKIDYEVNDRVRNYDLYQIFQDVFKDEISGKLKKIELIEALLFLSMVPLHGESLQHQMAMLATGMEILDRVIEIRR